MQLRTRTLVHHDPGLIIQPRLQNHLPQLVERIRQPIHGTFQKYFCFKQVQVIHKRKIGTVLDPEEFTVSTTGKSGITQTSTLGAAPRDRKQQKGHEGARVPASPGKSSN